MSGTNDRQNTTIYVPLSERVRPQKIADFMGQDHLTGENHLLTKLIKKDHVPSLIFWGPPGCGKTTLATIIANSSECNFIFFSAVLSGVKEIRQVISQAQKEQERNIPTILFVDEIHRFNKGQQDAFLPHVESGLITLIGATTENPSFSVIAPLLSRCQVLIFKPLDSNSIGKALCRIIKDHDNGLGKYNIKISGENIELIAQMADGDCRKAINILETSFTLTEPEDNIYHITDIIIKEAGQQTSLRYDKNGEEHYNLVSALHKSMRDSDPDGAAYWTKRMLVGGEDPLYIARRLIRFASEDIGNAEPQALQVALNCRESYHILGSPEGELAIIQAAIYLATAPKSNAIYMAEKLASQDIKKTGSLPVPLHLRNAPSKLMKNIGYGQGYQYVHDTKDGIVLQEHLPDKLKGRCYYKPTNRGFEAIIKDRLHKWRQILKQKQGSKNENS